MLPQRDLVDSSENSEGVEQIVMETGGRVVLRESGRKEKNLESQTVNKLLNHK